MIIDLFNIATEPNNERVNTHSTLKIVPNRYSYAHFPA